MRITASKLQDRSDTHQSVHVPRLTFILLILQHFLALLRLCSSLFFGLSVGFVFNQYVLRAYAHATQRTSSAFFETDY